MAAVTAMAAHSAIQSLAASDTIVVTSIISVSYATDPFPFSGPRVYTTLSPDPGLDLTAFTSESSTSLPSLSTTSSLLSTFSYDTDVLATSALLSTSSASKLGTYSLNMTLSSSMILSTAIPSSKTSPTLAKSAQIGLGIGVPLGALTFMGLGGLLVLYFLRLRQRSPKVFADTIEEDDYGIEVDPEPEDLRRPELEDTDTRKELDGEHWRRELPVTRHSGKSASQSPNRITTDSGHSRRELPTTP